MIIKKAIYGGVDVSNIVKQHIKNNQLQIHVCNSIFTDTNPGIFKYLEIHIDDKIFKIDENQIFQYPKTNTKILGIFYTNNNVPKVVEYCIKDLIKFKDQIDILTCSWLNIKDNPFVEINAMTKSSNHLNIILQILQLLYTAKECKNYDYVAFLEHDVLYPKNYFDFQKISNNCVVNMNYIGLSKNGFQYRNQDDKPLHQMIMEFEFAIDYFNKKIKDALLYGSVILEPIDSTIRYTQSPALHINHNQHFTSHYSIYSKNNIYIYDNEWGFYKTLVDKIF